MSDKLKVANDYCQTHLPELCAEVARWDDTGLLTGSRLRELAELFSFAGYNALSLARRAVESAAVRIISDPLAGCQPKDTDNR